ncbi:MAG: AAA family ATPase, partial [Burkholderiaceae bacterium]|nr:AAA family ATPase [Burkholderiaceae bacterium]
MHPVPVAPTRPARASPTRIGLLATLVVLLVVAILAAAIWLTAAYERNEREESLAAATAAAAVALRARLAATERDLTRMAAGLDAAAPAERFDERAQQMLADDPSLLRIELRAADGRLLVAVEPAEPRPRIAGRDRDALGFEATLAKRSAMAFTRPVYSRPYYVHGIDERGFEVVELAVPWGRGPEGALLAVHSMPRVLDHLLPWAFQRAHQVHLSEADGTIVARGSSGVRGAGVYTASAPMELQGATLHRLLDFRGHGVTFGRHRFNPIPADLIVVDEVSMVDVCLMADLAAAIKPGTRLILLGDKDQLPSVEAGAVLGNLLPGVRRTRLSEGGRRRVESMLGVGVEGA